jgi:hypothetical protein
MREAKYQRQQEMNRIRRVVMPSPERVREIADRAMTPSRTQVEAAMQAAGERAKQRGKEKAVQAKQRKAKRLKSKRGAA